MPSEKQGPKKRGGVRKKAQGNQKKPKRSDFKYPYLEPELAMLKRREEVADVASYVHKLSPEEKAWMNQFMREYNDASVGENHNPVFHTTKEQKKICYDKNNARNRCWYTEESAANRLNLVENDYELEKAIYGMDLDEHDLETYSEDNLEEEAAD